MKIEMPERIQGRWTIWTSLSCSKKLAIIILLTISLSLLCTVIWQSNTIYNLQKQNLEMASKELYGKFYLHPFTIFLQLYKIKNNWILADQLTLFKPGGQIMTTTYDYYLAPKS